MPRSMNRGRGAHQRRFFANARPECDLRYFSNSSALYLSGKAQYQTNSQGLNSAITGCTTRSPKGVTLNDITRRPPARLRPAGYAGHHASPFGHHVAAPREARRAKRGGARRDRTADLLHAMQALSQLSYGPVTVRARSFRPCSRKPCPASLVQQALGDLRGRPRTQFWVDLKSLRRLRHHR